jgi:putative salt-induced outer membrane protein
MAKTTLHLLILMLFFCVRASADQISLRNGDRLTGTIVKSDEKNLVLKTEYAGQVTLQWSAVGGISSSEPVNVVLKSGERIRGTLDIQDGKGEVDSGAPEKTPMNLETVQFIRSDPEQTAYDAQQRRVLHPRLTDFWSSLVDTGVSLTRGNADSLNFAIHGRAVRAAPKNRFTVSTESVFAKSTTAGVTTTTAKAIRGGLRDDITLKDNLFVFGSSDFEHDAIQFLDFRYVLGGGLGYHLIKRTETAFDLFGGGSYKQDNFSNAPTVNSAQMLAGEELNYKLNDHVTLHERMTFYPNLSQLGQYFVTLDSSTAMKLNSWLSWQVSFSDRYLTNPAPGAQKNDLLLTTGFRMNFGKGAL